MDKDYEEKLEIEEHISAPKRFHITREDLEVFGFTVRCPGCLSTARQAHTGNCQRRIGEELRGSVVADAAKRSVEKYQHKAAER